MEFTKYDLQDLYNLIDFFKRYPERIKDYRKAFSDLYIYINAPFDSDNFVRKIFSPYYNESDKEISWIKTDYKVETLVFPFIIFKLKEIISAILHEITEHYNDFQRCHLLCCASLDILCIITDDDKTNIMRRKMIAKLINQYRIKYNNDFLRDELRGLE